MKRDDIDRFEKLTAQLASTHHEIATLAKRSPNDGVNEFKLELINTLVDRCNTFFGAEHVPFEGFTMFSLDDLPTNSDVSFIIAQYIECAEKFRADNIQTLGGRWWWTTDQQDDGKPIQTSAPKKLG
jgi:hypothetical protein